MNNDSKILAITAAVGVLFLAGSIVAVSLPENGQPLESDVYVVSMDIRSVPPNISDDCPSWWMFVLWSDGHVERSVLSPTHGNWMPFESIHEQFPKHKGR